MAQACNARILRGVSLRSTKPLQWMEVEGPARGFDTDVVGERCVCASRLEECLPFFWDLLETAFVRRSCPMQNQRMFAILFGLAIPNRQRWACAAKLALAQVIDLAKVEVVARDSRGIQPVPSESSGCTRGASYFELHTS